MERRGFIASLIGALTLPKLFRNRQPEAWDVNPYTHSNHAPAQWTPASEASRPVAFHLYRSGNGENYHLIDTVPADEHGQPTRLFKPMSTKSVNSLSINLDD